jgi:hypothetical protein
MGKSARSREHIIPMWLLRATGDPNRQIKIDSDPVTGADVVRPASTFHFPACEPCNEKYGKTLEARAKKAVESLMAGRSLQVSQCYCLLDWLDKVRVGLWLGYNMLHKEEFTPKFRIDQRIGIKDRIAIISLDPDDRTKGFGLSGMDNQIFSTGQARMFLKINNLRILTFVRRFYFALRRHALSERDARVEQQPRAAHSDDGTYRLPPEAGLEGIRHTRCYGHRAGQYGNCVQGKSFAMYINGETIPRFRRIPKVRKPDDLEQFVQSQLISNASGNFQYHSNARQRLRFGQAKDNTDWTFVRALYVLFWRHVMPLNPTRVIDSDGTKLLGMLWLEKAVQIVLRLRQLGISDERSFGPMIDELQNVYPRHADRREGRHDQRSNRQGRNCIDQTRRRRWLFPGDEGRHERHPVWQVRRHHVFRAGRQARRTRGSRV